MRKIIKFVKRLTWQEQWNIAIAKSDPAEIVEKGIVEDRLQWLFKEKKDGFYADPFLIEEKDERFLFFEEFDNLLDKGVISCSKLVENEGKWIAKKPQVVLEEDHHLSYPFIFKSDKEFLMIPESSAKKQVALYRAEKFPFKWKKEKVLIDNLAALDSTIMFKDGFYWLFCTRVDRGENSALYVYWSSKLSGNWEPHERNPVKIDLASARPAGKIFSRGGKLYRPAQNSKKTYGGNIVLNEITKLSPSDFEEKPIGTIKPAGKYSKGRHTINFDSRLAVVDGKRFRGVKKIFDPVYTKFFKA